MTYPRAQAYLNSFINGGVIDSVGVNQDLYNGRLINYFSVGPPDILENKRFVIDRFEEKN